MGHTAHGPAHVIVVSDSQAVIKKVITFWIVTFRTLAHVAWQLNEIIRIIDSFFRENDCLVLVGVNLAGVLTFDPILLAVEEPATF